MFTPLKMILSAAELEKDISKKNFFYCTDKHTLCGLSVLTPHVWECVDLELSAYIKVELICPVADDFVLSCAVADLILVDLVPPRGIPIFIEEHWIASYA